VLNVAVGISAGVGALVSAVPALHPYMLPLCLGILALVTVVNLRGTMDAGRIFALPTYLFIASYGAILVIGIVKTLHAGGHPHAVIPPPPPAAATEAMGWWLFLRAFASGCTAMTGVEAVSNGMSAFREPVVRNGHRTLLAIVLILGLLLAGIAMLASAYGVAAMDQSQPTYRSVLSQLASAVVGQGWLYYVAIGSLLAVLALSADTSFAAFPRLCRAVAADRYLPKPFAIAGRRLVFSVGILYLAAAAGLLLVAFGGVTDHLIPLFAIGAFLTFTISQTGMVVHWRKQLAKAQPGARHRVVWKLWVNGVGAAVTGIALAVIVVAKFAEGAWITLLAIPAVIALLKSIRAYYVRVEQSLHDPTRSRCRGWQRPWSSSPSRTGTSSPTVPSRSRSRCRPTSSGCTWPSSPAPTRAPTRSCSIAGSATWRRRLGQRGSRPRAWSSGKRLTAPFTSRCCSSRGSCRRSTPAAPSPCWFRSWSRSTGTRTCCTPAARSACAAGCCGTAARA